MKVPRPHHVLRSGVLLSVALLLLSLSSCLAPNGSFQPWSGVSSTFTHYNDAGSGTSGDPFQIYTAAQMQNLAANSIAWSADYVVMNDIDMQGASLPLMGNGGSAFTGTFNGQGYTISDIRISGPGSGSAGVFGLMQGTIENLTFSNLTIAAPSSSSDVGAIATNFGSIRNVRVLNSSISGGSSVGSLAGSNSGTISGCSAGPLVSVTGSSGVGGLVGQLSGNGGSIQSSFALGTITVVVGGGTISNVGGLVGNMNVLSTAGINDSYATAAINLASATSVTAIGGLVGNFSGGTINGSYSAGSISGSPSNVSTVGGLIGSMATAGTSLTNSFAAESAISASTADYLVGSSGITGSTLSYWSGTTCSGCPTPGLSIVSGATAEPLESVYESVSGMASVPGNSPFTVPPTPWLFPGNVLPQLPTP